MVENFKNVLEDIEEIYPDEFLYKKLSYLFSYKSLYYQEQELFKHLDLPVIIEIPFEIKDWNNITKQIHRVLIKHYFLFFQNLNKYDIIENRKYNHEWISQQIKKIDKIHFNCVEDVFKYFKNYINNPKIILLLSSIIYPSHSIKIKSNTINKISVKTYRLAIFDFLLSL